MSDRVYTTGKRATPEGLRGLAYEVERWRRDDGVGATDLEAHVCAALMAGNGWQYQPAQPYVPPVKEGRRIVQSARPGSGPRIYRHWTMAGDGRGYAGSVGSEEAPAPRVLRDIGQAFGLLHGYVLLHLSDISANGLPAAHVGGGPRMLAEGKAHCGATLAATLVAAILRCAARAREIEVEDATVTQGGADG